jgi:WD40 repeat protein/serine/threonine protein kinase
MNQCPSREQLTKLANDTWSDALGEIESHIIGCTACQTTLADLSDETDVARWRRLLQDNGRALDVEEQAQLQQVLEDLKSNPPLPVANTTSQLASEQIQFPGEPTEHAPLGQLGDYDILQELGRGTFGAVYKAYDRRLGRQVAIKFLNPGHAAIASERDRFEREARTVSRLPHDHIVRIYDVCTASDFPLPYLVMEYVDGPSLAEQIVGRLSNSRGLPDPQPAARIAQQVALALTAAHERGLVHRDIKSSNILLETSTARAKVSDFGLARELAGPGDLTTRTGRIVGTLPYMSPEQILCPERVDARTDIYGLGVVLYELLTGERPFRGTDSALLMQVVHDDPQPPRKLNPAVPRDLETICLKCLAKESARRYSTASALVDDLQRFLSGEPIRARPVPMWERAAKWAKRQRVVAALLVAVALVTILGFTGVLWQWRRAETDRQIAKGAQADAERATVTERGLREQVETNLYFQRVARAHLEWLSNNLARADQLLDECPVQQRGWEWRYLRRLFHPEIRTLRGHATTVQKVACSPDGRMIASASGVWNNRDPGQVIVWDAHTGEQLQSFAAKSGAFHGLAFSPDSKRLAAANAVEGLTVWNLTTGAEESRPTKQGHFGVAFSPSGKLLAGAGARGLVRLWDAVTGKLKHSLKGHNGAVFYVAFSPDGVMLASTGHDGKCRIWSAETGQLIHVHEQSGNRCGVFSPDGKYLASCGFSASDEGVVRVWAVGNDWKEVLVQRVHSGPATELSISPDGRYVALNNANHGMVHVWEVATAWERITLRAHPSAMSVAFSPDGRTLVSGGSDRAVKLWDLTQKPPIIFQPDGRYVSGLAFSPDSSRLAIAGGISEAAPGRGAKSAQIWDVTEPHHVRLSRTLEGHSEWLTSVAYRADGKRFASADRAGEIRIWDPSSGQCVLTIERGKAEVTSIAFSLDCKSLAAGDADAGVRTWDAESGRLIQSLEGHEGRVNQVVFSPDGSTVASASDDRTARLWDLATGRSFRTLGEHDAAVRGVAFDSRGRVLATCDSGGLINLFELRPLEASAPESRSGERRPRALRGHTAAVTAISFNNDDTRLASISDDGTVRIWDVATGQVGLTMVPDGSVTASSVCFSADGNLLAAARARHVTLWDASDRSGDESVNGPKDSLRWARIWHESEAAACKRSRAWFGEVFHLSQLIALEPNEPRYYHRRGDVYTAWSRSDSGHPVHFVNALADYRHALQLRGSRFLKQASGD